MQCRLKMNSIMRNKIWIRDFTTKKPVPKPKPKPKPKPNPNDPIIVGLLIFLGIGQLLKFIEYKNNFHIKK